MSDHPAPLPAGPSARALDAIERSGRRSVVAEPRQETETTITKAHAQRLARAGKATIEDCCTVDDRGIRWRIVTRHDVQRVDHYRDDSPAR